MDCGNKLVHKNKTDITSKDFDILPPRIRIYNDTLYYLELINISINK